MTDTHFDDADYDSEIGFTRKAAMCVSPIRLAPGQVTTLTGKISRSRSPLAFRTPTCQPKMGVSSTGTTGR